MDRDFYTGRAWKRVRAAALRRDGYACRRCRRYGRMTEAKVVHHIKHLEDAPDLALSLDNLVSVCNDCHNALHPEKGKHRQTPQGSRF